jgi:hypothetical protein
MKLNINVECPDCVRDALADSQDQCKMLAAEIGAVERERDEARAELAKARTTAAQVSAYKAATPFGEMGQIMTPHDGGQAASGRAGAEPFEIHAQNCAYWAMRPCNCAQCDKLRAEGGVK